MQNRNIPVLLATAAFLVLFGAGCSNETQKDSGQKAAEPTAQTVETSSKPALANPAAVKCNDEKLGYRIDKNELGEYGVCVFDDKSECEEWAYFRGECAKSDCKKWEGCQKMLPGDK